MATIDADLKTFLQSNGPVSQKVGARIYENHVPAGKAVPFIWFAQTGEIRADALADAVGTLPIGYRFALECVAQSIRDARAIGSLVVACTHLLSKATFGSRTIGTVFCEDQNDDYIPQSGAIDMGFHVSAFSVEVYL